MDWRGVDYLWIIVMLLSAVWTLILMAPIHCGGSIGEQVILNLSKSDQIWKNKTLILHLGWPEGEYILSKFSLLGELFL